MTTEWGRFMRCSSSPRRPGHLRSWGAATAPGRGATGQIATSDARCRADSFSLERNYPPYNGDACGQTFSYYSWRLESSVGFSGFCYHGYRTLCGKSGIAGDPAARSSSSESGSMNAPRQRLRPRARKSEFEHAFLVSPNPCNWSISALDWRPQFSTPGPTVVIAGLKCPAGFPAPSGAQSTAGSPQWTWL